MQSHLNFPLRRCSECKAVHSDSWDLIGLPDNSICNLCSKWTSVPCHQILFNSSCIYHWILLSLCFILMNYTAACLLWEEYMSPFMQLLVHLNSATGNWAIENQEKQKLPDMEWVATGHSQPLADKGPFHHTRNACQSSAKFSFLCSATCSSALPGPGKVVPLPSSHGWFYSSDTNRHKELSPAHFCFLLLPG